MKQPPPIAEIAADMLNARPFRPHAGATPRSLADGYSLQDAVVAHLLDTGARQGVAGYKVAANAPHLMRHFGLDEPVSARVFADEVVPSGASLSLGSFHSFAIEPEIAAVFASDLPAGAAPHSPETVAAAIGHLVPAFELLDLRGTVLPQVHLPDVVAQNVTNVGAVPGGPGCPPGDVPGRGVVTELFVNDTLADRIEDGAPQPPIEAATWMANHLASRGIGLEAGQIVLLGTHTPIRPITEPCRLRLSIGALGEASLILTA